MEGRMEEKMEEREKNVTPVQIQTSWKIPSPFLLLHLTFSSECKISALLLATVNKNVMVAHKKGKNGEKGKKNEEKSLVNNKNTPGENSFQPIFFLSLPYSLGSFIRLRLSWK